MLVLRLAIALALVAAIAGLILWIVTRQRSYLRLTGRALQLLLALLLAALLWLFWGRLMAAFAL